MRVDPKNFETYEETRKIYIKNENVLPLYNEIKEAQLKRAEKSEEAIKLYEEMEAKKAQFLKEMGELDKNYKERQTEIEGMTNEIQFMEQKISPILKEEVTDTLDEFEDITSFDVDDNGVFVNVMYLVDLWVKTHRENTAKRKAKALEPEAVESPYVEEIKN